MKNNPWDSPDVVSVFGTCKKCGKPSFIGEDGICVYCFLKEREVSE